MQSSVVSTGRPFRLRLTLNELLANASALLRLVSPWILLVPAIGCALIAFCRHTAAHSIVQKETEELIAPAILAVSFATALGFWLRSAHTYAMWSALFSGALLWREFHFAGTDNGIYVAILLLFWYGFRHSSAMRPYWDHRGIVNLLAAAIWTYCISKTFDRNYWRFIPGSRAWTDPMEESLETLAHLLVLVHVVTSLVVFNRSAGQTRVAPLTWRRSALAGLIAAVVSAGYIGWDSDAEPARAVPGAFPLELSSLAPVSGELGNHLFLASSDESRSITIWTLDVDGQPKPIQQLELIVERDDGPPYQIDDLEDLAWDGANTYFAVGSHRHLVAEEDAARLRKHNASECAVVSFRLERIEQGYRITDARTVTRDLLAKIRELDVFPSVNWNQSKAFTWSGMTKDWQINIEGLAWCDGHLLLGFKNPIESGRATILSYDLADGSIRVAARPDLDGHGILGMHYDRATERLLVLSNEPHKKTGDSKLWVAMRHRDGWQFSELPSAVLEKARDARASKASGVIPHKDGVFVCFDAQTQTPIRWYPLPR